MVEENWVCGCGRKGGARGFDVRFGVKPRNFGSEGVWGGGRVVSEGEVGAG